MHHRGVFENVYTRTSGTGLYVQVRISLDPLGPPSVTVSPNTFRRLADHRGADDEYYVAVQSGARSALQESEEGGAVSILRLTMPRATRLPIRVRLASRIAVHNALRKASGW